MMLAEAENKALGFADAQTPFEGQVEKTESPNATVSAAAERLKRVRYNMAETPLSALATAQGSGWADVFVQ